MFDDRFFDGTYDLYRPTTSISAAGTPSVTAPSTATASDQPCKVFPKLPAAFRPADWGIDQEYDAALVLPASQTLKPAGDAEQPDEVEVAGKRYTVMAVVDAAGQGLYNLATLQAKH